MKLFQVLGMTLSAVSWLSVWVCLAGGVAEENYYRALELGIDSNFSEAQKALEQALTADPFYPPALICLETIKDLIHHKIKPQTVIHFFKAMTHGNKSQWKESLAEINRALQVNPRYATAHNHRGNVYHELGQYDQAIAEYNAALKINPQSAGVFLNRGIAYRQKDDLDRAIADFDRAIGINPLFAQAYFSRGNAHRQKGQWDQAIADFDHAIKINQAFAEAYFNKALTCEEANCLADAAAAYKSFLDYAPVDYEGPNQFARNRIEALEILEKLRQKNLHPEATD